MQLEADLRAELGSLLATRAVHPEFQPIVDLVTGEPVAYEALSRGPLGSPLHSPAALFEAAYALGRVRDLDQLCQTRALEAAVASNIHGSLGLFVNVEPVAAGRLELPVGLSQALRERGIHLVAELTERALVDDPSGLLGFAERARAAGWSIALDDVGANTDSLALLPFLRPEFVKLDLDLVQRRPDATVAETMTAVTAYAEQCDAAVLAEGIESEHHEHVARSFGAVLGQGWRYGRPGPLPSEHRRPTHPLATRPSPLRPADRSAFAAAAELRAARRGSKGLLLAVSTLLERQAAELPGPTVVLSAFERAHWFTPAVARRYADLAKSTTYVVALGEGLSVEPVPGVRGAHLEPDDPMREEWVVAVVGPHFAGTLVARDLDDDGPDMDRRFDYVLTYDRDLVLDVARSLMSRALPAAG